MGLELEYNDFEEKKNTTIAYIFNNNYKKN